MESLQESMNELRVQLGKGLIQKAYQGLMDYIRDLRNYLKKKYPDYTVPGNIYYGYMDMTYFSVIPEFLKLQKLRIAIVFDYETFRFEVWLSGFNRDIQEKIWKLIKESGWDKYKTTTDPRRDDYIVSQILINDPDFSDLDGLTTQIEQGVLDFTADVEEFIQGLPSN